MPPRTWMLLGLLATAPIACSPLGETTVLAAEQPTIEIYVRTGCPRCAEAKRWLEALQQQRPELVVVQHDVGTDLQARAHLEALVTARGMTAAGVPTFVIGDEVVVGFSGPSRTGTHLLALLDGRSKAPQVLDEVCDADDTPASPCAPPLEEPPVDVPILGHLDPARLGLPLFTVAMGLVDGFNPCAMWVLLFLLSLLVNLRDRLRMLAIAGTFVLVSGTVYFAFMAAWLNVFLLLGMSRSVQVVLGLVALAVGAINVKDFFAFKQGVSLSIPETARPGVYQRARAVLRADNLAGALVADNLAGALVAAAVLAVLVNLLELLCTAGLPAVYTQILSRHALSGGEHYGYLALYNVAYMFDDSIMVGVAVWTLSKRKLQERGGRQLKLVSGSVMAALGLLLLFMPSWLLF